MIHALFERVCISWKRANGIRRSSSIARAVRPCCVRGARRSSSSCSDSRLCSSTPTSVSSRAPNASARRLAAHRSPLNCSHRFVLLRHQHINNFYRATYSNLPVVIILYTAIVFPQLRQWRELQREKLLIEQRLEAERARAAGEKLERDMEVISKRRQEEKLKACPFSVCFIRSDMLGCWFCDINARNLVVRYLHRPKGDLAPISTCRLESSALHNARCRRRRSAAIASVSLNWSVYSRNRPNTIANGLYWTLIVVRCSSIAQRALLKCFLWLMINMSLTIIVHPYKLRFFFPIFNLIYDVKY